MEEEKKEEEHENDIDFSGIINWLKKDKDRIYIIALTIMILILIYMLFTITGAYNNLVDLYTTCLNAQQNPINWVVK